MGRPSAPRSAPHALTSKGAATRARIVDAAVRVFSERGFLEAKITDITATAGTASGTFYVYFDSKEQLLVSIADTVTTRFIESLRAGRSEGSDPAEVIGETNRQYIATYRENADVMRVIEQAATFNSQMTQLRRSMRERFVERAARNIRAWEAAGLCRPAASARTAAALLVAMVDNLAYSWIALGQPFDEEVVIDTMNTIWIRGLQIRPAPLS